MGALRVVEQVIKTSHPMMAVGLVLQMPYAPQLHSPAYLDFSRMEQHAPSVRAVPSKQEQPDLVLAVQQAPLAIKRVSLAMLVLD